MKKWLILFVLFCISQVNASELVQTIKKIKPSVVGVGVFTPTGRPKNTLHGTGFVVGNGKFIVTNHHVVPKELKRDLMQELAVFIVAGKDTMVRKAKLVDWSAKYDLALLKIEGKPLTAMKLGSDKFVDEGTEIAFTGFPIGAALGLYPATHRGIIAAVTPTITPVDAANQINIAMLKRLRDPYMVYQLDATAYPGNSGSAMYDANTGTVLGVINKVFVQETKEGVISNPSGITYAIPVKHVLTLLKKNNVK